MGCCTGAFVVAFFTVVVATFLGVASPVVVLRPRDVARGGGGGASTLVLTAAVWVDDAATGVSTFSITTSAGCLLRRKKNPAAMSTSVAICKTKDWRRGDIRLNIRFVPQLLKFPQKEDSVYSSSEAGLG